MYSETRGHLDNSATVPRDLWAGSVRSCGLNLSSHGSCADAVRAELVQPVSACKRGELRCKRFTDENSKNLP